MEIYAKEDDGIAELICSIHSILPEKAVEYLLKSYTKNNEQNHLVIGKTHFLIAKNLVEIEDFEMAKSHFISARTHLSKEEQLDYINEIDEYLKKKI